MRALLLAAGLEETPVAADADVAIVNTCSFLASATEESVEATLALAEERAAGVRACPIVMCGCVPSRYGDALAAELPEVAAFVRAEDEDGIVGVVREVLGLGAAEGGHVPDTLRTVEGTSAFVKISEGCDRFCTFCAIPYIRGRYHSRPADEIVSRSARSWPAACARSSSSARTRASGARTSVRGRRSPRCSAAWPRPCGPIAAGSACSTSSPRA